MKTIRRSSEDVYDESLRFLTEPFRSPYRRSLYGPRPLGPEEIDGFLVPPGKAFTLLTASYYWLTAHDEPAEEKVVSSHSGCGFVVWLYIKHLLDVLGKSHGNGDNVPT